jgi:alpha-L-fucosidase
MRIKNSLWAAALLVAVSCAEKPYGAVPSPYQLEWQEMEMNMFCHFGPNTFTGREWGDGTEAEDLFNPSDLDCRQWAATARAAGFKGIIITAKHHDGFCLWPNPVSRHTVAQSAWKDGKGDVLKELSDACREYGLKFGIYISPWDRNDPHYGTPEYNNVFVQTLESALGGAYGPVYEQWFDGACGEGPNGKKQVYDWPLFNGTVLKLQPQALIFSDVGPGCRWVGNESGSAGRTNWGRLDIEGFTPGQGGPSVDTLNQGNRFGSRWIPAETDVSIRPGWFWKASETPRVKSVQHLLKIWYESVGRNSLLLLNVPPDDRGHIDPVDSTRLMELRGALDTIFADDLAGGARIRRKGNSWTVKLNGEKTFNRLVLKEDLPLGQRIAAFTVEALTAGGWQEVARETTVGFKRIVLLPDVTATAVRIRVDESLAKPFITHIALYQDDIYREVTEEEDPGTVHGASEVQTLDLGDLRETGGFFYTPAPRGRGGVIIDYRLEVSADGTHWTVADEGMFDNIVNNPVRTEVRNPFQARYLRLTPLRTSGGATYGISGFGAL